MAPYISLLCCRKQHALDQELLKDLLDKVAKKFGYTEPDMWQDGLFVSLSEEIEKETRFIISRNTLKRLFGKIKTSEHYNPQIETRNALARYAGFPDWNKFRMQMLAENGANYHTESPQLTETASKLNPTEETKTDSKKSFQKKLVLAISLVVIVLLAVFNISWPEQTPDYSRIKVTVTNPIDTAPFTLVINYEIPSDIKDSLYIGVGGTNFYLEPKKKSYVHSLSRPIYSFIYLRDSKKKLIRAIAIKAYSRDLECYYESGKNVLQIPKNDFIENGMAGLKRSFFATNRLDSSDFISAFVKVKDFDIDGDNFKFICRYKVDKSPKICHNFQLKVFADSGHHELEIHNKGCEQYNFVAPAELYFGGKFENLTKLSTDLGAWHDLEMEVRNKDFVVTIDGKKRFFAKYKRTMGKLTVLKFQFNGFGQVDYYRMLNAQGKIVDKEEF
jgi:hypothetical protein